MTPERWKEVKAVFQEALAVDAESREAWLEGACGGDAELRGEVSSMLAAYDGADDFLTGSGTETRPMFCAHCGSHYALAHVVCPSDGEVLVEDPQALVDTTLDELYHLEAVVGRGGFGTVYRARHELLRDRVAVKVLRREFSANPSLVRRFLREGRVARAVHHPNIVAIHDLRTSSDGLVYMVLEYVEGRTLRDVLRERGRLERGEAIRLLGDVARALDAAHEAGVVHRDLKPENVMLGDGDEGRVKVLDLGLAKLREIATDEPATELTLPGQQIGSPHYMSPEQWGERPADGRVEIDARADVYALGVMAHELLTGRRPFTGETIWDVRRAHLEAPRPADAGRAIARALARDRRDRFETPGAFVAALAAEGAPNSFRSRLPRRAFLAGALAATGGAATWLALTSVGRDATPKSYAEMTEAERLGFVGERAVEVSRMLAGRDYHFPPDVRTGIKRQVDRYAARVGTGRETFGSEDLAFVFERARRHAPAIAPVFERAGVPLVVALYLPMIESEFRADQVSSMGARGMFQIIPKTGERYGATPTDLDAIDRSAEVAARHFRDCMDEFASDRMGNALALAAYNLGARDIRRYLDEVVALDDAEAESRFWSLASNTGFDAIDNAESPRYITSFFAAAIVGENPSSFGLAGDPLSKVI
jgi:tRNA A-37 threonylcarbamoyl transferase component Bud32